MAWELIVSGAGNDAELEGKILEAARAAVEGFLVAEDEGGEGWDVSAATFSASSGWHDLLREIVESHGLGP